MDEREKEENQEVRNEERTEERWLKAEPKLPLRKHITGFYGRFKNKVNLN